MGKSGPQFFSVSGLMLVALVVAEMMINTGAP